MQTEIQHLIDYRIKQAWETSEEVKFQIENNFLVIAVNRIYYGMFYMFLALALREGYKTSKHKQLIGWFNKEFVKTGKIDRETGKIIHQAYQDRTDGDYGLFVQFEKEEVQEKYKNMNHFLEKLEEFVKEKN